MFEADHDQGQRPAVAGADHLTAVLCKSGVLGSGWVRDVIVDSDRSTVLSRILRLRLAHGGPAPDAPGSVILKTGLAHTMDPAWNGGRQEVAFYTKVAPALSNQVVPRCFDAQWDPTSGAWHLILEDLSDSHYIATQWPLPPTHAQCQTILTARARLHAAWWDDARLGVSVGERIDDDGLEQYLRRLERHFAALVDSMGDSLPPARRDLFERFLQAAPRLFARYRGRNVTIVQGDAHVWNCFLPRTGGDDVRLFDWDSWHINIPTLDLSYMMAMHWYPGRRQRIEQPLLDHYHDVLLRHGITG